MRCAWRRSNKSFLAKPIAKKKAKALKKVWQSLTGKTVMIPPSYFTLAQRKRLPAILNVTNTRERCILDDLSKSVHLLDQNVCVNLSQNMCRSNVRTNGTLPTLDHNCRNIFFPAIGRFLSPLQAMALQGFDTTDLDLTMCSEAEIGTLAGNTMSVPVIGTIMYVALAHMQRA
jgi:hypothetical protein